MRFLHKNIKKERKSMNEKKEFKPYIPADKVMPELTVTSVIIGVLLAILFGGANAYLGLRVGMTVSASIPAAVISMGIIRFILRRDSILENNMVQTIGSAGESVAAGAIFTLPALFMWAQEEGTAMPSLVEIALIALIGGFLGVLFMIPLRSALIVQEHGVLPYPEGQACAEVLVAGEEGGAKAGTVFAGLGIAAVYKFIADGLKVFPSEVDFTIKPYKGSAVGADVLPALLGVGYICGPKVSSYLLAGGSVAWFMIMPLIALFGGDNIIGPALIPVSQMSPSQIWSNYVRYIGAGAVAAGGILSLIKSLPLIVKTFSDAIKGMKGDKNTGKLRTEQDIDMKAIAIGIVVVTIAIWLIPDIPVTILGAILIVIFGFFFATVSSRMVGIVGSSNNPVSGMAIATLLFATLCLKVTGDVGVHGMKGAIGIGSVICIIAAMAGDTSQDLKTGYILGATPKKQQIGELLGAVIAALTIGGVLVLLDSAWGFGTTELAAPQATLMKTIVEGVMQGNLPWALVFIGVFIALVIEILGISVLPVAIGLYLPLELSATIMIGGLIRHFVDKKSKDKDKDNEASGGILFCSGLIAGEGLVGILLAIFAVVGLADPIDLSGSISLGTIGSVVLMVIMVLLILKNAVWTKSKEK